MNVAIKFNKRKTMKTLIAELDERIAKEIRQEWERNLWGEMPDEIFEREYERACQRIVDHLVKVGVKHAQS
jgi:hypothetical protein